VEERGTGSSLADAHLPPPSPPHRFHDRMVEENVKRAIIVTQQPATPFARQVIPKGHGTVARGCRELQGTITTRAPRPFSRVTGWAQPSAVCFSMFKTSKEKPRPWNPSHPLRRGPHPARSQPSLVGKGEAHPAINGFGHRGWTPRKESPRKSPPAPPLPPHGSACTPPCLPHPLCPQAMAALTAQGLVFQPFEEKCAPSSDRCVCGGGGATCGRVSSLPLLLFCDHTTPTNPIWLPVRPPVRPSPSAVPLLSLSELMVNVTKHELVPKHEPLSEAEKKEFLKAQCVQ